MNWRVKKYQERQAALASQSNSILDQCAKDGDREPTAEETATLDQNRTELDGLRAKIERETALAQYAKTAPEAANGFQEGAAPGMPTSVTNARPARARRGYGRISQVKAGFESDPKRGFESPRDFCMAVMAHGDRPSEAAQDQRLRFLASAGSDEQGTYSEPYGGFLVPMGFHPELLQVEPEDDPIGALTTKIPMEVPRLEVPARTDRNHSTGSVSGGLIVTRRAEALSENASRIQMEKVAMVATSLFGLNYTTEELLADSPITFAALLEKGFSDQFAAQLINERLFGTGVGEFEGVMNSPALITVAKDSGQAAQTITYSNVINMRSRCWHYQKAMWLYNHDALPQLMSMYFSPPGATALALPLWQQSARDGEPDRLLGRPAYATEWCQTVGTPGDLILAVWGEYLEGTYEPMNSAESVHVRFVNHERTFKFWLRNAGRGWWRTPLTPRRSASTLSPFVALAQRS